MKRIEKKVVAAKVLNKEGEHIGWISTISWDQNNQALLDIMRRGKVEETVSVPELISLGYQLKKVDDVITKEELSKLNN